MSLICMILSSWEFWHSFGESDSNWSQSWTFCKVWNEDLYKTTDDPLAVGVSSYEKMDLPLILVQISAYICKDKTSLTLQYCEYISFFKNVVRTCPNCVATGALLMYVIGFPYCIQAPFTQLIFQTSMMGNSWRLIYSRFHRCFSL